jgi:two-component system response regulator YesN
MSRILIADRDQTERTGITWFIKSNQIRFEHIDQAISVDEVIQYVERYTPSVVCIELEMIPHDRLSELVQLFQRYVGTVICLTAEAVFERSLEAIELHTFALLLKPVSPSRLKETLLHAYRRSTIKASSQYNVVKKEDSLYELLFIDCSIEEQQSRSLMLLQAENPKDNKSLYDWIKQYPFPFHVHFVALSDMVACLMDPPADREHSLLQQEGHRLLYRWREETQNGLNVALHLSSFSSLSLHQVYIKTKAALKLRFFKGNQQLFLVDEELSQFQTIDPFLTPEEQRAWIKRLEEGDKEGIKVWLYEAFTQYTDGYPEPDLLRIRLTSILAQLRRFMQTYYLEQSSAIEERYHQIFQKILYHPVLFGIVQEMLLFSFVLIDGADKRRKEAITDFVERGLRYMEQNYHLPQLSLESVAAEVGRSANYFSHLVAQKKKKTFRQLLREIRINNAKKLLRESLYGVQEISEQVGYTDPNYFSRVFKEVEGMSPRAYQQQEKSKVSGEK